MAGLLVLAAQCTNENVRPVALFTVDRVDGPSPLTVNFDGSGSYDPDGTIEAYSWDFGDGTSGTGITTTHTFSSSTDRTFSVKLTVTDNGGRTHSMSGFVVVYGSGSGAVLFFDDFEDGANPAWFSTSTRWAAASGTYNFSPDWGSIVNEGSAFVVSGTEYQDYDVELDLQLSTYNGYSFGVILRAQEDLNSMIIVKGTTGSIRWFVFEKGQEVTSSETITPGLFVGWHHIKVEAHGDVYKLFIEGLERSTFQDAHFVKGMPGVFGRGSPGVPTIPTKIDNFTVTSVP